MFVFTVIRIILWITLGALQILTQARTRENRRQHASSSQYSSSYNSDHHLHRAVGFKSLARTLIFKRSNTSFDFGRE